MGGQDLRWELEPLGGGTQLTLWINIDRRLLERLLADRPIGRLVGPDAMEFDGWQRLNAEYAKQVGVEAPAWPSSPR